MKTVFQKLSFFINYNYLVNVPREEFSKNSDYIDASAMWNINIKKYIGWKSLIKGWKVHKQVRDQRNGVQVLLQNENKS